MFIVYIGIALVLISIVVKFTLWMRRIRALRQFMPVVPVVFAPTNILRNVIPRKLQKFHNDWCLHHRRSIYRDLGSDVIAFVSLFQYDQVWVSDPASFVEVKVTNTKKYPKDLRILRAVSIFSYDPR